MTWVVIPVLSAAATVAAFQLFFAEPEPTVPFVRARNSMFIADDAIGYSYRPNLNVTQAAGKNIFHMFTNVHGARVNGPSDPGKIAGGLIAIGGSQVYGHGVENEKTFASLVAKRLGITAANFGVSGQGGVGALLMAKRFAKKKPKIILYGFWVDHYNRNVNICAATGNPVCTELPTVQRREGNNDLYIRLPEHPDHTMLLNNEWNKEFLTYQAGTKPALIAKWDTIKAQTKSITDKRHVSPGDDSFNERIYSAADHVLKEMKAVSEEHGAILCVIYIPGYSGKSAKPAGSRLTGIAKRHGIMLVDMADVFSRALAAGKLIGIPGDEHLSVRGHKLIADAILERLKARGVQIVTDP